MRHSHDLDGLMKFLNRDGWGERFDEVLQQHFAPACKALDIEAGSIGGLIGDQAAAYVWGCAFEDFLTREFGPGNENFVDSYLKRRGWNERAQAKSYMKALRRSAMSFYEVSDIVPGKSFRARDMIRGGEPVVVSEVSATQQMKQWDRFATRIVPVGNKTFMSGGTLLFSHDLMESVVQAIEGTVGGDALPREIAPLITGAWLTDAVRKATGADAPALVNSEGEDILFHTLRFGLRPGVTQAEIAARLDGVADLRAESDEFWNWLGAPGPMRRPAQRQNGQALITTMDDGSLVLGNVDLDGKFVTLSVNSAGRAAQGRALLEQALGDLVLEPVTETQTVEQMRAAAPARKSPDCVPPEQDVSMLHEMLDEQYRQVLDEPVPVLGDISPRAAICTEHGRRKVVEWLKYLENRSASDHDPTSALATYDFGWIWRELQVEEFRK
jgi:hypothetical protein